LEQPDVTALPARFNVVAHIRDLDARKATFVSDLLNCAVLGTIVFVVSDNFIASQTISNRNTINSYIILKLHNNNIEAQDKYEIALSIDMKYYT